MEGGTPGFASAGLGTLLQLPIPLRPLQFLIRAHILLPRLEWVQCKKKGPLGQRGTFKMSQRGTLGPSRWLRAAHLGHTLLCTPKPLMASHRLLRAFVFLKRFSFLERFWLYRKNCGYWVTESTQNFHISHTNSPIVNILRQCGRHMWLPLMNQYWSTVINQKLCFILFPWFLPKIPLLSQDPTQGTTCHL